MEGHAKLMVVTMVPVAFAFGSSPIVSNGQKVCDMSEGDFEECRPSVNVADPSPPLPSAACCKALDNADFECLCSFNNSLWMMKNGVDFTRAKGLPGKCNLRNSFPC
ncbi:Dolichyl-diphosphooligosaccharide-protein glycosyltransferase 48kDa subunit family protein [Hibiscus syriacus]|uniref:Dolichyl-diphosphooligosaccharide-protein glycosyltransferase 48kDa subunit family protein n=1 Tax=Hibiscus syriacus TaxID=106335 RepID=A0A6A2ZJM5_HIBSY|nr:putative lipid-transfer protein DIR1 [Hibiscus syriacus]KAE8691509.1 Dolichyl-diphosphooligosaccharide-protein glycosyltransferase 48kDa subunit family protein [Hibiscus syriacus]